MAHIKLLPKKVKKHLSSYRRQHWKSLFKLVIKNQVGVRVAIPLFGNNISPRFDCSESILLIDITKFHVKDEDILEIGNWPPSLKNNLLSKLKVDVLLCGGIRKIDYLELTELGIEVYPSLTGKVEEVKRAFIEGKIPGPIQKKVCSVMQSSKTREGEGTVGQTKSNKNLSAKKDT